MSIYIYEHLKNFKKLFSELVPGRMECQCRKDMQWNRDALECQVIK